MEVAKSLESRRSGFSSFPKGVESGRQGRGGTQRVGVGGPSSLMPDPGRWQPGSPPTSLPTQQAVPELARAWLLPVPPAGGGKCFACLGKIGSQA